MFGKRLELFKAFDIPIRLDVSWVFVAILVTWSLAAGVFPTLYPDLAIKTYWIMGVAGALGLFASIVVHELSHAVAARKQGVPMRGITLFIFGGVADMDREPPSGRAEFIVAIAGPIASIAIALVLGAVHWVGQKAGVATPLNGVVGYLSGINALLVAFNMIPAFPLDGGRVLRAALWHFKGSLRRATRISSQIGSGFGLALIVLGVFTFMGGSFVGGLWWFLIGMFLRHAAQMSYQQIIVRRMLEGERISDLMHHRPVTVAPAMSVQELVQDYVYEHHFKMFPVVRDGRLEGCVTTRNIRQLPRSQWTTTAVEEILEPCSNENTIEPSADALVALSRMTQSGQSRLLVVSGEELRGIVSLKDLLKHLALRVDLEEDDAVTRSSFLSRSSRLPSHGELICD